MAGGSSEHSSLGMGMAAGAGTGGEEEEEEGEEGAGTDLGCSEGGEGDPGAFVWTEEKKKILKIF